MKHKPVLASLPIISKIYSHLKNLEINVKNIQDEQQAQQITLQNTLNEHVKVLNEVKNLIKNGGFVQISKQEVLTKIFSGAKMYLDSGDASLVPHLLLDGEWEHNVTQAWLSIVKSKDTILDIGANFGYFGLLAAQQCNRDCKVIMFEANPELIPYIYKTLIVNSMQNCCIVENLAISNSEHKVSLNILKDYTASSSIYSTEQLNKYNKNGATLELEKKISVPATTIDIYCKKNNIKEVNVIKMDIEGYEQTAYEGMRETIKASSDITLFVEFTNPAYKNPKHFFDQMLEDFGHVYLINESGAMVHTKASDYKSVIGDREEWVMLVFSKNRIS